VYPKANDAIRGNDSRCTRLSLGRRLQNHQERVRDSQGLCGAALESGKPIIVGDVHKDPRYLPTFHTTRSEIVVPMRNEHRHILGMLDVESDQLNAFGDEDRQFLERAGGLIAHCLH
jgi:GAF domain-containing protein